MLYQLMLYQKVCFHDTIFLNNSQHLFAGIANIYHQTHPLFPSSNLPPYPLPLFHPSLLSW